MTSILESADLLEMQREAHTLMTVTLGGAAPGPNPFDQVLLSLQGARLRYASLDDLLPRDSVPDLFGEHVCENERRWTATQHDQFANSIRKALVDDQAKAKSDRDDVSNYAPLLDIYERDVQAALAKAKSQLKDSPPGKLPDSLPKELEAIGERMDALDQVKNSDGKLETWIKTVPNLHFNGYGNGPFACQTDLDGPLAELVSAGNERVCAAIAVAELKARTYRQLTADASEMATVRADLEQARQSLQPEVAKRLEVALTSAMGFWVTIGLLAIWRLTDRESSS
ncbi:MAG TPA: hypothetical protein VKR82_00815 [Candidatus Acidoferrales bacterium]|nr:hypothetical protein [Candidatus Acidoferrales bacterium]